jgi:hypothetical protein
MFTYSPPKFHLRITNGSKVELNFLYNEVLYQELLSLWMQTRYSCRLTQNSLYNDETSKLTGWIKKELKRRQKLRDARLAVAMSLHSRLGKRSLFKPLNEDLLAKICSFVW